MQSPSDDKKRNLAELNAQLMKNYETKISENLQLEKDRNDQLLNLLNQKDDELISKGLNTT